MSEEGCAACRTSSVRFRSASTGEFLFESTEAHHALLRAERERAEKAEAELAHHKDPIVDKLLADRDRLAATVKKLMLLCEEELGDGTGGTWAGCDLPGPQDNESVRQEAIAALKESAP